MTDPLFSVQGREPLMVDQRLTPTEIKRALDEIERLSFLPWPNADASVRPIETTNNEWHRQKMPDQRFRTIFKIDRDRMTLIIIALLVRDNDTYNRTVRHLYLAD